MQTLTVNGQISMQPKRRASRRFGRRMFSSWVLTRLHTRYSKDTLSEDLVFAPAKPVVGGRGSWGRDTEKPGTVRSSSVNQFQGPLHHPKLLGWAGDV